MRTLLDRNNFSSRTDGQVAVRRVTGLVIKRLRSPVVGAAFQTVGRRCRDEPATEKTPLVATSDTLHPDTRLQIVMVIRYSEHQTAPITTLNGV